jgi:hypothetical protein
MRDNAATEQVRFAADFNGLMRLPVPETRYVAGMIAWNRAQPQRTAALAMSY